MYHPPLIPPINGGKVPAPLVGEGWGEGDSWRILLNFITTPVPSFARRGLRGGFNKQIPYFIDTTGDSVDALHEE